MDNLKTLILTNKLLHSVNWTLNEISFLKQRLTRLFPTMLLCNENVLFVSVKS